MTRRHVPLPRALSIGPHVYTVRWQARLYGQRKRLDGLIDYRAREIVLDSSVRGFNTTVTLLHEALHGLASQMNVKLTEREVESLSYGLAAMLDENPDLLTYLVGESARRRKRKDKLYQW